MGSDDAWTLESETADLAVEETTEACEPRLRTRESLRTEGLWTCEDDWRPRGAFAPLGVRARAAPLGFPLRDEEWDVLREAFARCADRAAERDLPRPTPLVAFHGTHARNWDSIRAHGLWETFGMLGHGVYLADFDKAAGRYALRDADYGLRDAGDALVVRVFATARPGQLQWRGTELPRSYACPCVRCARMGALWARVADHEDRWRRDGFRGCAALADQRADPTPGDARMRVGLRRVLRNDEYCLRNIYCFVQDAYIVDPASATHGPREAYNPMDRGLRVA